MLRILPLCLCFLFGFALQAAEPLRVLALHPVLAEFARELGGDRTVVVSLLPAGSDPHAFNPSPEDVRRLSGADCVFATGLGFEPWLDRLVRNSGFKGRLVEVSTSISDPVRGACLHGQEHAHGEGEHGDWDPHWWHSPRASREVLAGISTSLQELLPDAAADIARRFLVLDSKIQTLESWARTRLEQLPPERRLLVTSHDAFGYLARDFGFRVHPLVGVSPEAEPDARALARLIDFIRSKKLRSVFVDNTENPHLLATMLRESGAKVGGTLLADGPAAPGSGPSDYAGMFRHNIETIALALE